MREQITELEGVFVYGPHYDRQQARREAADIANFAMLIATNARSDQEEHEDADAG